MTTAFRGRDAVRGGGHGGVPHDMRAVVRRSPTAPSTEAPRAEHHRLPPFTAAVLTARCRPGSGSRRRRPGQ
jgi:hypothetical protein